MILSSQTMAWYVAAMACMISYINPNEALPGFGCQPFHRACPQRRSPTLLRGRPTPQMALKAAAVGAVGFPMVYKRALPLLTSLMGALALAWALGRETDVWMIGILTAAGAMIQTFLAGRE